MQKIIFATQNPGKLIEMRSLLSDLNIEILSAKEAGIIEDVVEDKETFEENSLKKARFIASKTGEWSIADDSGICIKALNGMPGVYSARWAGEGADDQDIIKYTLDKMKDVLEKDRSAWFETAVVLVSPQGEEHIFKGQVNGKITTTVRGENTPKLPYDAIFVSKGNDKTFAEMSGDEKNAISHRGQAFQELKKFLIQIYEKPN